MMLTSILIGAIVLISDFFLRSLFFGKSDNRGNSNLLFIGIALVLAILSPIIGELMKLAISRKREFLADASGALLTRYPEGLAKALAKINSVSIPMSRANNATAHLFISNPFGSEKTSRLHRLFMTHPPVEERIEALTGMTIHHG